MKDLIDTVEILFRVVQKMQWDEMPDEVRNLMRDAKGKLDRARESSSGRVSNPSGERWKADTDEEKAATRALIEAFVNGPEGEDLNEFEDDVLQTVRPKFEQYGSISIKQLAVLRKAWERINGGPIPTPSD